MTKQEELLQLEADFTRALKNLDNANTEFDGSPATINWLRDASEQVIELECQIRIMKHELYNESKFREQS